MVKLNRRSLLAGSAGTAIGLLQGCGGGDELPDATIEDLSGEVPDQVMQRAGRASADTAELSPAAASAQAAASGPRYRNASRYLFQAVDRKVVPSRLPGGSDHLMDVYGPSHRHVDVHTGWAWTRPGGDWIDAKGVRHGTTPWFLGRLDGAEGNTAVKRYAIDVTRAVAYCQSGNRWCALLLQALNARRLIAGHGHRSEPAPFLMVTYQGGSKARLKCRVLAVNSDSASRPLTMEAEVQLPAFAEFERPAGVVTQAVLHLSVTQHWRGLNATLAGFVLDPPLNRHPVQTGAAASAGALDASLATQPGIIGVHRYLDGTSLNDFALPQKINFNAERHFDPAIFDNGPTDRSKLPHLGLGKWINAGSHMQLVSSRHAGEGFEPLAPGLGALRLHMPAQEGVVDGSLVGSGGTTAGQSMLYLPEALFGRLPRIFVRYYVRLGMPAKATQAMRKQVVFENGASSWITCAGKFGITPNHTTSYGGNSGSSGGGGGWQMRHSWYDCTAETGGPDEGGWAAGYHLYDFYYKNPPGHNYGHEIGSRANELWGQQGGQGGLLYGGQWYCVETELKLNSLLPDAPGYLADGALRTWIDGRLCYERTGMVFRTAPLVQRDYNPMKLRPCRELGVRGLWMNWFHGGRTPNTMDRTLFYTGLAWSKRYIGPMKF